MDLDVKTKATLLGAMFLIVGKNNNNTVGSIILPNIWFTLSLAINNAFKYWLQDFMAFEEEKNKNSNSDN